MAIFINTLRVSNVDYVHFNTNVEPTFHHEGNVFYDTTDKTITLHLDEPDVALQVGQELYISARNSTGSTITNGSVVYVSGVTGNSPTIALAKADNIATAEVIGVATHDIENNTNGYITTFGKVKDIDTTAATNEGDMVYLSPSSAGTFTSTKPTAPDIIVHIGFVLRKHATQGILLVRILREF